MVTKVSRRVEAMMTDGPVVRRRFQTREHNGFRVEWEGPGSYGLIRRAGEEEYHWSMVSEAMFQDWQENEWDFCNKESAQDGWRRGGWADMKRIEEAQR